MRPTSRSPLDLLERDKRLFTPPFVKWRAGALCCSAGRYQAELDVPGSVRGGLGLRIRQDIERQRRTYARSFSHRIDVLRQAHGKVDGLSYLGHFEADND
jgi:hypothetical protein